MKKQADSDQLTNKLNPEGGPIGIASVQEQPDNLKLLERKVTSACTFWPQADDDTFYAIARHTSTDRSVR